jgi:hypothetical protein
MSTVPAAIKWELKCSCDTCKKVLHESLSSSEEQFRENSAKAMTASELHDCKGAPKQTGS